MYTYYTYYMYLFTQEAVGRSEGASVEGSASFTWRWLKSTWPARPVLGSRPPHPVRLSPPCLSGDSLPATTMPLIGSLGCIALLWILHCVYHLGLGAHYDAACRFGLRAHLDTALGISSLPASIASPCTSLGSLMGCVLIALLPFQLCIDACSWSDCRGDRLQRPPFNHSSAAT